MNRRILVIDDQESIHEDFRKILGGGSAAAGAALSDARSAFFGEAQVQTIGPDFELEAASQGVEGVEMLERAYAEGQPFAMAFVDVRMPPGLDGMQTIERLWQSDPNLEVVICTAYSDYSFEEIVEKLGYSDRLLILKKPFDPVEVRQLAGALTEKWNIRQRERERLAELERSNAELGRANLRAEAASQAKSEFLANMSHEIRTPLNALLGYVDLLSDPDITSEEQHEYSETMRRSGEHLLTILNDILDISKIEACRMVVHKSEFSPLELAREVTSLMQTQAHEKDLSLELEVPDEIPEAIVSDPVRVRQILLNLVGNAIKFTSTGSVHVALRASQDIPDHGYFLFEIVDTGIGIAESQRDSLFEPFSQADTSSTRRAGGTGLGLAISKRLATMLGGDVELVSEVGKGSTFTLRIHAGDLRDVRRIRVADAGVGLDEREASHGSPGRVEARVLLVEDVKFNQVLISTMLKKSGAEVTVADNGRLGVEHVQRAADEGRPFDLVLMDMQMPVLDGYAASREIRDAGHDVPMIALTAHAMAGDREKCLAAGCTEYMTKPLDRRVFIELCRALARGQGEPRAPLPSRDGAGERQAS